MAFPAQLEGECERIGDRPVTSGSTFDIWKGLFLGQSEVAMKLLRNVRVGSIGERDEKRFHRQVDIWRTLSDAHVLKLHGWCVIGEDLYLVSPWMINGDICSYLRRRSYKPEDYISLLRDILLGLKYLHSQKILHGSLQPSNILIDDDGSAVLSDFALAKEITPEAVDSRSTTSTKQLRYQAPEVDQKTPRSVAGDIYSWAMAALEIVSGVTPFQDCTSAITLLKARGKLPLRTQFACRTFRQYPALWDVLESCWGRAEDRPGVDELLQVLQGLESCETSD